MQPRHPHPRRHQRPVPLPPVPSPAAPPIIGSALSLPSLHPSISSEIVYRRESSSAQDFALNLVDLDVLTTNPAIWGKGTLVEVLTGTGLAEGPSFTNPGSVPKGCEAALSRFCDHYRPRPWAELSLLFTDDCANYETPEHEYFQRKHKDKRQRDKIDKVGCFAIHFNMSTETMIHRVVGPTIQALEKAHPQLGRTILGLIDGGLDRSARGITPVNGIGWAGQAYWWGEGDEEWAVGDQLEGMIGEYDSLHPAEKKLRKKPTADDVEIFRKSDYAKAIPTWVWDNPKSTLSIAALEQLHQSRPPQLRRFQNIIHAAVALAKRMQGWDRRLFPDNNAFDSVAWEISPFILRWDTEDPLGQIFDDNINPLHEAGEKNLEINSVFGFYDLKSMRHALHRLATWLEILQLSEDLLRHLGPDIQDAHAHNEGRPTDEPVRIRIPV